MCGWVCRTYFKDVWAVIRLNTSGTGNSGNRADLSRVRLNELTT